ncbi:vacuolar protein sorting-associated protein 13A/C [Marchantia polymorpha subsp. ruderalis]|uniref:Peroxin/Ferlin domain-containing protein n=2 Tax=Marchantia polymorpha TaxID=3197 RepID=A0AAF6AYT3_MARPO|nr:hypothetical protein MARPO_0105s0039 [Marchantia polymorpha]BBN04917.1 hypothetical protein Mp_3g08780 [Marchantia polymorpha subsp. ruderalis]|eukprot:PTQ31927.1 hypothetical protein MARPO_0105s0039 [Marchantia polymorpha]
MVFEEHVAYYLERYLGNYVKGLSKEALKISVWQGNVELTNMQLKPEALNSLKLPIKVKAGFLGSVKLKVPWSRLGQEPVVVLLDRIYLLAEPATNLDAGDDSGDAVQEAKMKRVKDTEAKLLERKADNAKKEELNNTSWLGSLISTIIGNLKLSITNIHIRYEDCESNPGHPFAAGLTLEKLAAVTVDGEGKETFITGGSLDRIQKSGELQRLSFYFDPDTEPWKPEKKWEDLLPKEWAKIFGQGIGAESVHGDGIKGSRRGQHHYLLAPVGGTARYSKLANKDTRTPDQPAQKAIVVLDDVTIGLSEVQYRDALKVAENFSTFNKRLQYAHYRPSVPIKQDSRGWWQYAYKAIVEQQKQASGNISWKRLVKLSELRKQYVSKYVMALQSNPSQMTIDNNKEIQDMDRELDTDIIIQWRMLAHTYVDQNRAQDQKRQQEQQKQQSWWLPFGWAGQSNVDDKAVKFTDEEWDQLNQLIGYQHGKQSNIMPGQEPPNMLHTVLEVRMRRNATKLVASNDEVIMELSGDELQVNLHMYPKTVKFDMELASYQLSCPEGLLMESATKAEAVNATFIYLPMKENLDWSLAAKCSPCYVTVFMPSINRLIAFFQTSRTVSRSVALETATALQSTLDEVTRNAQQQINKALKDRPRFKMDLDIAAPKVTIPTDFYPDGVKQSKLLLDFGHFNLKSDLDDDPHESAEENRLYMRFRIRLTDVSAILVDGDYDWKRNFDDFHQAFKEDKRDTRRATFLPLLEKCGMLVALQQICVPHPQYPSTRVAVRLPSLGFQFSPARYHRLMQVMKVFQNSSSDDGESSSVHPWEPSDFEGQVSVLAWKGVGHREAVWQHRYAALAGPFLYLLESSSSQTYKYCSSLIGKQASVVPPDSIGDVPYVLAVCDAGQFNNKVAESVNALLLRFEDESTMNNWQGRITGAIYRASAPVAVAGLVGSKEHDDAKDAVVEASEANEQLNPAEQESFFLTGALDELKIIISNSQVDDYNSPQLLLGSEIPLLEFRAIGTKVEYVMRTYDMSVGAVLQALEVEDKFHGHVSPSCKYLARSYIKTAHKITGVPPLSNGRNGHGKHHRHRPSNGKKSPKRRQTSESDRFFDAPEEFLDAEEQSKGHRLRRSSDSLSKFFDAEEDGNSQSGDDREPPSFKRDSGLLPLTGLKENGEDVLKEGAENFVKAQVIMCSQDSPDYGNVDKQVKVTLATLSFFANRPTLLALLDLVTAINADVEPKDPNPAPSSTESDAIVSTINPRGIDEEENEIQTPFGRHDSVVKGLLGRGKSRMVFLVVLYMDRAQIFLNLEDGSQLAVLAQEDLHTEIKIFPASFGIKVALGNLKVSDGSLDNNHPYHYVCNMRDPQGTSFVELEFLSFNKEDDDYEGYEYSIKGKLSELRIVYLNRFIQEISSYFMGLVPQNSGYVVKLKDRFTDVEKFFTQSEIEGQPALKLGLSLSKPVIIMPRSTKSTDFLELDILHINVSNSFNWLGGEKDELGAVRLETTTLQLEDLHLVVGVGGKTGEGIIQEANGLSLVVRRPIRDLWHQLPAVEASIKIEKLKAALSDKEYQVITECAISNMAETPNLPPPVIEKVPNEDKDGREIEMNVKAPNSDDVEVQRADNTSGSASESWTTIKVGVGIKMVELSIFTGKAREAPLASVQVTGVWAAYKSNSIEESTIMATLEKFSVRDDREGTELEMRYMIGSADEEESNVIELSEQEGHNGSCSNQDCRSALTMLVMDANLSPTLQTITLRIQRPRLLVALDFLLAVAEFFIPSMHAMLSDGKGADANPIEMQNAIFLDDPVYKQSDREISLSPKRPLVADKDGLDKYIYDGRGGTIRLLDRKGADLRDFSREVIMFVGDGKRLKFKNVIIQNGDYLDSCISLGSNSSYSASEDDGVFLEGQPEKPAEASSYKESGVDAQDEHPSMDRADAKPIVEIIFNLQAIAPELTFYDSMKRPADSVLVPERLLRARMNVFSRFILKGEDMELNAQVNGLTIEASSGIHVLEPVDMGVKYTKVTGKQHIHVDMSEVVTNFSFSILQLILRLQTDVMSFLRITSEQTTVQCSEFDKIWADDDEKSGANCITFWRPRAPPGFAILGDCLTPRDESPSKGVTALNMSFARVKRPVDFVLVWSSYEAQLVNTSRLYDADDDDKPSDCSVWLPVAPKGYVVLGCVATPGRDPPPLNTCFCVLAALVTPCQMRDCIIISRDNDEASDAKKWAFWRVDNSTGSFYLDGQSEHAKPFRAQELRQIISNYESFPVQETKPSRSIQPTSNQQSPLHHSSARQSLTPSLSSGRIYESIARFELIWWNKGSGSKKGISIWRPVIPAGCVILGDIAVDGYLPPDVGLALRDNEESGQLCKPLRFYRRGQVPRKRNMGTVSFWFPVAPVNYVAMGCIASTTSNSPPEAINFVRCVRKDLVIGANFSSSSLWDSTCMKSGNDELRIWPVENEAHTFFVIRKIKAPPKELALRLADYQESSAPDNIVSDVEVKRISATFFDDYGGLMAPLVDVCLSGITGSLHGRMESMSCTANFNLTATSFNGKYSAWEPLVEPWDGRVRFSYSSDPENRARPTVTNIRLTASSELNINLSTANVNMLLEAYASWNRMNQLEEKSKKQFSLDSKGRWSSKPALDLKSQENLSCVSHNELGEELFLRIVENKHSKVLSLPSGGSVSVRLPTAHSIEEPGAKATSRRNPNKFVAVKIGDAQVPRDEGIGGRDYMVAIRVVPRAQSSDQRQLQYQSARTRSVPPEDGAFSDSVTIHWDEIFVFEVESEEGNTAEIVITDLSKGGPVGFCSTQLSQESTKPSVPENNTHIPWSDLDLQWELVYPTQSELKEGNVGEHCGRISLAKHFFSIVGEVSKDADGKRHESGTFQFSPSPEGPWSHVGLNYALGAAPWQVNKDIMASEFYVDGGVKHLIIRSLVVVQNGTDFDVEVSLCMVSALGVKRAVRESGVGETVEEEVFENERYQPLSGWGSKWPGHLLPSDPGRYSDRDSKGSTEEFPAVKLPPGWTWISDWHVDQVAGVDEEGWSYGFDFRNLNWPPTNGSERLFSFVRRRRWVRSRQSVTGGSTRVTVGTLAPGGKIPLPIACLRATSPDYCLQIRPQPGGYHPGSYKWSQVIPYKGFPDHGVKQESSKEIRIQSLVETEELLSCSLEASSSLSSEKDIWFCLETTATSVGKDAEMDPIKDWKLVITAPLMLTNYLPVPSEYSVSEKRTGKGLIVRERGIIKPGEAAGIFHADLRKPLHLTWLPQGGWQPKKETVIISHPYRDVANHMMYTNSRTSRSMEVMIEHDHEVKGVAAKVVRIYVPCWLDSAKCPALQFRIIDLSKPGKENGPDRHTQPQEGITMGRLKEQINQDEMENYQALIPDIDVDTMGLSVAVTSSNPDLFGPISPLSPLNNPDGTVELRGLAENGSFFRFLVTTSSCPLNFVKTKVFRIRPYILFTNRCGQAIYMKQKRADDIKTLHPADWRVSFPFPEAEESELLQIKLDGCQWSLPFSVDKETTMHIALRKEDGGRRSVRIEIRGYEEGSRFLVMFRLGSARGPYRLDNRTNNTEFKIRQNGLDDDAWMNLPPHSTKTFAWEDHCQEQLLEVLALGNNVVIDVNKIGYHPALNLGPHSSTTVSVRVLELMEVKTVRFFEEIDELEEVEGEHEISSSQEEMMPAEEDAEEQASAQTEVVIDIPRLGLSVTDHKPQEILYLFLGNVIFTYQMGFGARTSSLKLRVGDLQLDNQLPLAWMPVLLAPERRNEDKEFLLTATVTMYDDSIEATTVFSYVGVQVQSGWRVNVHEPIIWAIVEMYNNLHLDRLSDGSDVVQVDPEFRIDLIDVSEVRLKLTLETAPAARPRGMLGYWSPLVTGLGNTNKMPIHFSNVLHKGRYMRKSQIGPAVTSRIRRDLIHQPLLLLSGVDFLGNASSTIGTLSKGAAQLSNDGKYLRLRSKKDRARNLSGVGDGLIQGTEALARGFAYGLTGVVTKPITNARQHGFVGFFQGVGKAAVGFVMLPVSGVLEFVSLTVNGVGVSCTNCFEIFDKESHVKRTRVPRAIRGDGILQKYDSNDALGQALLHLAQSGALFGFREAFSEPAKYAWSDFYENHIELPKNKVLMLTNRRVMMLVRPASHFQKPEKLFTDPSSIEWEVPWRNVLAVEIAAHLQSIVVLHLRWNTKSFAQVIKCYHGEPEGRVSHSKKVVKSICEVWKKYGPDRHTVTSEERRHAHQLRLIPASLRSKRSSNPGSLRDDGLIETSSTAEARSLAREDVGGMTQEVVLFRKIWISEQETGFTCSVCSLGTTPAEICTIWRPQAPDGYVCVGDIVHQGVEPPAVATTYKNAEGMFAKPISYDLVWRNWKDGFTEHVSIWMPKPPQGYVALGCVAVAGYMEPDADACWCIREDLAEHTEFEDSIVWEAPVNSPWDCYIYPITCEALTFFALREHEHNAGVRPRRVKLTSVTNVYQI